MRDEAVSIALAGGRASEKTQEVCVEGGIHGT